MMNRKALTPPPEIRMQGKIYLIQPVMQIIPRGMDALENC